MLFGPNDGPPPQGGGIARGGGLIWQKDGRQWRGTGHGTPPPPVDSWSFKAIRRARVQAGHIEERQSPEVWETLASFNVPPKLHNFTLRALWRETASDREDVLVSHGPITTLHALQYTRRPFTSAEALPLPLPPFFHHLAAVGNGYTQQQVDRTVQELC